MQKFKKLAAAALMATLISPLSAQADQRFAEKFGGKVVRFSEMEPKSVALSVGLTKMPSQEASSNALSSGPQTRRLVVVDGVLMYMSEGAILAHVSTGAFKVVYPGTNILWDWKEDRVPFYPPPWFPDH